MQLFSMLLLGVGVALTGNAYAWHCPSHPHVDGKLIYKPACCDERSVAVKGKFDGSDCFEAISLPPPGKGTRATKHIKKNYTCELDGALIVFGETAGEACCQFIEEEKYKCVAVLPGASP